MIIPYATNLLDPRWQKKKASICERDKWICQLCQDDTAPLHVHHRVSIPGYEPWDYPDDKLITLCDNCHIAVTRIIENNFPDSISRVIADATVALNFSQAQWRKEYYQMLLDKYQLAQEYINSYFLG